MTFTADLGQGEEVEPARKKAEALGIKDIYIEDVREEFVRDYVFPMFRAMDRIVVTEDDDEETEEQEGQDDGGGESNA